MYALGTNSIDFKNYSMSDGLEYTLHHKESESDRGIQVNTLSCFESLWNLFKKIGARKVISLETNIVDFLPTALIFGKITLI